jgi:hypothetical protein
MRFPLQIYPSTKGFKQLTQFAWTTPALPSGLLNPAVNPVVIAPLSFNSFEHKPFDPRAGKIDRN